MPLPAAFRHLTSLAKMGRALAPNAKTPMNMGAALGLPIGIDFGTGSMKVLQVNPGEPPTLVTAAAIETPEDIIADPLKRLEFQVAALPGLVKEAGFKGKRAVCAIPAWATVCKHMQLSRADGATIDTLVAQQIPLQMSCDPSQIVYRFLEVTPPTAAKPEVIVMAVSRELVTQFMGAIRACKLDPVGMHSEFAAALHAFDYIHKRDGDVLVNTLYLDIGQGTTGVAISHGKQLAFARVIDLGGASLDAQLAGQLGCTAKEARTRRWELNDGVAPAAMTMAAKSDPRSMSDIDALIDRRRAGVMPGLSAGVLSQEPVSLCPEAGDLSESMDILSDEVRMCLRFHAGQFPDKKVERVVFIGGESRHRGLCQHIAKSLKLPAHMADPLARIARTGKEPLLGVDITRPQPGWVVAMGLCLAPTDL